MEGNHRRVRIEGGVSVIEHGFFKTSLLKGRFFCVRPIFRLLVCFVASVAFHFVLFWSQTEFFGEPGEVFYTVRSPHAKSGLAVILPVLASDLSERSQSQSRSVDVEVEHGSEAAIAEAISGNQRHDDAVVVTSEYVSASALTRRPRVIQEPTLEFPFSIEGESVGRVIVRLLIGVSGSVDKVIVEDSDLPASFKESVVRGFLTARFSPGEIDDLAVPSSIRAEVNYRTASDAESDSNDGLSFR